MLYVEIREAIDDDVQIYIFLTFSKCSELLVPHVLL